RTARGCRAPAATSGGAGWCAAPCPSPRSRRRRCLAREASLVRDQPVAHAVELRLCLLVVVVPADVEPVVLAHPRADLLALCQEPQDQIGEVEPLAGFDVPDRVRRE